LHSTYISFDILIYSPPPPPPPKSAISLGVRHVEVMAGGLELSKVDSLRSEYQHQQGEVDKEEGGWRGRYGREPLQLLQVVVVHGCGFVDQPLLPAFILYCTGGQFYHRPPPLSESEALWQGVVAVILQRGSQGLVLEEELSVRAVQMPLHITPLYHNIRPIIEKEQGKNDWLVATAFSSSSLAETSSDMFANLLTLADSLNITIWPRVMNILGSNEDMDENNINWQDSYLQEYVLTRSKVVILLSNNQQLIDEDCFLLALNYLLSLGVCVIADSRNLSDEILQEFGNSLTFMDDFPRDLMSYGYPYLRNIKVCERKASSWFEKQGEKNFQSINLVMQSARTHERIFSINSLSYSY